MTGHRKWSTIRKKFTWSKEELVCISAGRKAFRLKVYPDGNLYRIGWQKAAWLKGYRQAEREFKEEVHRSKLNENL